MDPRTEKLTKAKRRTAEVRGSLIEGMTYLKIKEISFFRKIGLDFVSVNGARWRTQQIKVMTRYSGILSQDFCLNFASRNDARWRTQLLDFVSEIWSKMVYTLRPSPCILSCPEGEDRPVPLISNFNFSFLFFHFNFLFFVFSFLRNWNIFGFFFEI